MRHIYNPLRRKKIHRFLCGFIVFFVSAVFHEYIISGALGGLHYSAFIAMLANWPASLIQELLRKSKKINRDTVVHNVMFWISFVFLGQPLCFILYFKSYYAENPQYLS
jgi:diacylglycerol O-acyltransferase 1